MKLVFEERAWSDYLYWQVHDPDILGRVNLLIKECTRTPFSGLGKPEPLADHFRDFGRAGSLGSIVSFTGLRKAAY